MITMFNIILTERTDRENKKPAKAGRNEKFVTSPSPVNAGLGPDKNNSCQSCHANNGPGAHCDDITSLQLNVVTYAIMVVGPNPLPGFH